MYPARFPKRLIEQFYREFEGLEGLVFDPFAGSGSTGVAAWLRGVPSELWDINPVLLVNVDAWVKVIRLREDIVSRAVKEVKHALGAEGADPYFPREAEGWWPEEAASVVARVWGYFQDKMASVSDSRLAFEPRDEAWSVFAALAMYASRKLSFSDDSVPKYFRSRLKREKIARLLNGNRAADLFRELAEARAERILRLNSDVAPPSEATPTPRAVVVDSLTAKDYPGQMAAVVTSPPYLQAQEYIRSYKFDLLLMGFSAGTVRRLQSLEIPYRSVPSRNIDSPTYHELIDGLEHRFRRVAENYFSAILSVLERSASSLIPRGLMYVFVGDSTINGKEVRIGKILAEHFTQHGFSLLSEKEDKIVKSRLFKGKRNNKNPAGLKLERLIILRKND